MGKQLLLIRHGKSDWGNSQLDDFDRPLNERGITNAPDMASRLKEKDLIPELVVSSKALRAITTAKLFAQTWSIPAEAIVQNDKMYLANPIALLQLINQLDNSYQRIALFGHNPGFTDLVNYLSDANIYNIPTCGAAVLQFDTTNWAEISQGTGTILEYDFPKSADDD